MPTDIMKETDRMRYPNTIADGFNQKFIEIQSIWQENNNGEFEKKPSDLSYPDYVHEAQIDGFIVGMELENVKAKSRRSLMQQMSNHISINFQSLYGKENNGVRQNYFQIGVRVPTKEHVSEIVGKQGNVSITKWDYMSRFYLSKTHHYLFVLKPHGRATTIPTCLPCYSHIAVSHEFDAYLYI